MYISMKIGITIKGASSIVNLKQRRLLQLLD